jgi:hypothetical protein
VAVLLLPLIRIMVIEHILVSFHQEWVVALIYNNLEAYVAHLDIDRFHSRKKESRKTKKS